MKIYKSENYISEKLTIKPISKTRLGKILDVDKYISAVDMRSNLQTGDIAVIGNEDDNIQGTYISYNDIKSGVYDNYFHFIKRISELPNSEITEGLFVFWEKEGFYTKISVQEFDDDLKRYNTFRIMYVYRLPLLLQKPLPEDFFKTNHIPKAKLIWSYNGKSVNEKLTIQPFTKDRLSDYKKPSVDEETIRFIKENNLIWNPVTKSYDCEGDVKVSEDMVIDGKLKIKFGNVDGNFNCSYNILISLEGTPQKIGRNFYCNNNKLTTLEGAPNEVGGSFNCSSNSLTTLKGTPNVVGGNFRCSYNHLTTLEGAPQKVGGNFDCYSNDLTTLKGAPQEVGGDFDCCRNKLTTLECAPQKVGRNFDCGYNKLVNLKGAPQKVGRNFYCSNNKLTTLEGAPQKVYGDFYCDRNHLTSLKDAPNEVGGVFSCSDNKLTTLKGTLNEVGSDFYCNRNNLTSLEYAPQKIGGIFYYRNNKI